mmetsp:Transcript_13545/g.27996  ORF Transcript_13545/g.27996 Transcript_13545/m.27996 type:complete len:107 (+) Transcript_13545:2449-2769(+)
MKDGGQSRMWLLFAGISKEGAMGGRFGIIAALLHQTASAATFFSSITASMVRGDKKDGRASPYCHKSCVIGLEGNVANNPFVEKGVVGMGRGRDGMLGKSNRAEDQ